MAPEAYSNPLSPIAKEKLIAFVEACIGTFARQYVDETNERAKQLASDVLQTDIDIVAFVTTIASMYSVPGRQFVSNMIHHPASYRQAATVLVEVAEQARKIDKSSRTS